MNDTPGPARANCHALLGLIFDSLSMADAKALIRTARAGDRQWVIATPNVNFLAESDRDPSFRDTLLKSNIALVDGKPVLWLARLAGLPLPEKVSGSDLIEALIADASAPPLKVYFFGGVGDTAALASQHLNRRSAGLISVGDCNPGFGDIESMSRPELIANINAADPDLLIVSLGAKKGHQWIEQNRGALNAPVISHLGAVVNFVAGTQQRSPLALQRLGLEWTWRIYQEPSIYKRYAADAVSLAKLCATRMLPLLYYRFRYRSSPRGAQFETGEDTAIVHVFGPLDADSQHHLADLLNHTLNHPAFKLVVDLSGAWYLDSALAGQLLAIQARAGKPPANIELSGVSAAMAAQCRLQGIQV